MRDSKPYVRTFHALLKGFECSLNKDDVDHSRLSHANLTQFSTKNDGSRYKSQDKENSTQ